MTKEKLEQANELSSKIKKIEYFLIYYKQTCNYNMKIVLDNNNESCCHSESIYFKEHSDMYELIKESLNKELNELKEEFKTL